MVPPSGIVKKKPPVLVIPDSWKLVPHKDYVELRQPTACRPVWALVHGLTLERHELEDPVGSYGMVFDDKGYACVIDHGSGNLVCPDEVLRRQL